MKNMVLSCLVGIAALTCLPAQAVVVASPQTIDLGTVYTGSIPTGPAPWLSATFAGSGTSGTLTLNSSLESTDFVQGGKNSNATIGWAFFLDPNQISSISCTGGSNCADDVFNESGLNAGPVPGDFNLSFSWSQSDRFMSGDSAIYDIVFGSALADSPFKENGSGWSSVAHIQGIAPNGCSGWIVAGTGSGADGGSSCGNGTPPPVGVSEPDQAFLFLLGMIGVGVTMTLRRRRTHM